MTTLLIFFVANLAITFLGCVGDLGGTLPSNSIHTIGGNTYVV